MRWSRLPCDREVVHRGQVIGLGQVIAECPALARLQAETRSGDVTGHEGRCGCAGADALLPGIDGLPCGRKELLLHEAWMCALGFSSNSRGSSRMPMNPGNPVNRIEPAPLMTPSSADDRRVPRGVPVHRVMFEARLR